MLDRLMDGRPHSAGELALVAGVTPSTASEHLTALTRGGLVTATTAGRERHYSIANADVAEVLETVAAICSRDPVTSLRQSQDARRMAILRTCYDHLAGSIAVELLQALIRKEWLRAAPDGYDVTRGGKSALLAIGVDVTNARTRHRAFARPCLDRTARQPHLAGTLGASLAEAFVTNDWVRPTTTHRGMVLTPAGYENFSETFGLIANHS